MKNRINPAARIPRLAIALIGLVACAAPARNAESRPLRATASGYETQVLVDGVPAPTLWHDGESYVLGRTGQRYVIRVLNHSAQRIEAVVTVDGRDVIDGKNGDFQHKRGYLVPAWGQVDIDGWRLSESQAAAFRFSSVADSYAARTGNAREVGVIGVAVFPERIDRPRPVVVPPPRCCLDDDSNGDLRGIAPAESRAAPVPAAAEASESGISQAAQPSRKAASSAGVGPRRERPGLGTEFGEAVASNIQEVEFVRASASVPAAILGVRYNDRDGLLAMGVNVDGVYPWDTNLRRTADPFPSSPRRYAAPPAGWQR
jgi:hypothetical protein